jgi:hypothetical protein
VPNTSPRAAVAHGQVIFNSRPIKITGVAGINDDVSAGGLAAGGISSLTGTCGTCHDTPMSTNMMTYSLVTKELREDWPLGYDGCDEQIKKAFLPNMGTGSPD